MWTYDVRQHSRPSSSAVQSCMVSVRTLRYGYADSSTRSHWKRHYKIEMVNESSFASVLLWFQMVWTMQKTLENIRWAHTERFGTIWLPNSISPLLMNGYISNRVIHGVFVFISWLIDGICRLSDGLSRLINFISATRCYFQLINIISANSWHLRLINA